MGGEDFAWYGRTEHDVPTMMYWLGTVPPEKLEKGQNPGLHSPFYYPVVEESIRTGVTVSTQAILDLMK